MPLVLRVNRPLTVALALATGACGAQPGGDVGPDPRVPTSLSEALRAGRPARVIVLLDDGPALAAAVKAEAAGWRHAEAQESAVAVLEDTKASLLGQGAPDEVAELHHYDSLPALHVELRTPEALDRLLARSEVARVVEDEPHEAFLAQSLPLIHQPEAAAAGLTGAGTAVAVLDTGVDYTRAAFGACPAPGAPGCRVAYAHDFAPDDGSLDANGHGTNVAAIVAGVAPGAKILALDVFNGQYAYTSDILAAVNWCVQHRADYNIVAMNLSLGSGGSTTPCTYDAFAGAIRAARAAGILTVAASGNDGRTDRIASPACVPEAVSVGAVYDSSLGTMAYSGCTDSSTAADQVACFSNSAPFLTMLAPGVLITAGGSTYIGTSQASPHVAGAVAVLKSAAPDASPDELVAKLRTGPLVTDRRNGVKTPRVDLASVRCVADLSAAAASVDGAGGAVALTITTGPDCAWTVAAPPDWLILSAASGTGSATITATAAPNAGAARSAALSAGGQAVHLAQGTDRTAPVAGLTVAGGARYTRSLAVPVTIDASDPAGVAAMCLSNSSSCGGAWRPPSASVSWTLAAGTSGPRSVILWVKDGAGNVSSVRRTIVYDVSAPVLGLLAAAPAAGAIDLSWPAAYDPGSGVARYTVVAGLGGTPSTCAVGIAVYSGTATSFRHTGLVRGARWYYRLCATDGAGNTTAGTTATAAAR
jgi:hypothetical protein